MKKGIGCFKISDMSEKKKAPRPRKKEYLHWEKLDNSANIFPVIAGEEMTNTYRISVVLNEDVNPNFLQEAVDRLTVRMPGFNLRLRSGFFWYYLEEIDKPAPRVVEENTYPCRFIHANANNGYMFRVTYYGKRINFEAFHVIADGTGGINFLRELTYQYLRLAHPELEQKLGDGFSPETSMDREDSFLKNFKKGQKNAYRLDRAFLFRGERLPYRGFGVIHGIMSVSEIKKIAREKYNLTINEYLVAAFVYATYRANPRGVTKKRPVRVAVPVNLRPYFDSITTKNFFCMAIAEFVPEKDDYTFAEVAEIIRESLKKAITKENLEKTFSFAVSNSEHLIARVVPLPLKNGGMKFFYNMAARSTTTTITNIGNMKVDEDYRKYIRLFYCFLPFSTGQRMKGTIASFNDTLMYTIVSAYRDTSVQEGIFRQIASDGAAVSIETNGVYYE